MDSLSTILAGKWDVTKKEAQQFLADFVEIIKEGVDADGLVKIKGLGTFKVIDVDARESVNVNTGQRVLIESHQKLTFTPDALMKELVNKPFSHFETVILNEGVEFSDINEEEQENTEIVTEKEDSISEKAVEEEPIVPVVEEEPVAIEEEPIAVDEEPVAAEEESDVAEEEPAAIEEEPTVTNEAPITAEEEPAVIDEEPSAVEEEPHKTSWWWLWLLLALLACGLSFGAGYWLGIQNNAMPAVVEEQQEEAVVEDTTSTQEAQTPTEPLIEEETEEPTDTTQLVVQAPVAEQPQTKTDQQADWQKYDAMDKRIRLGYYGIVGLDREVKAMEGETLAHLSRRILGPDMDCYVEVFNGLKATDVLTGGQKIKIPKLVSKKRLREQNN